MKHRIHICVSISKLKIANLVSGKQITHHTNIVYLKFNRFIVLNLIYFHFMVMDTHTEISYGIMYLNKIIMKNFIQHWYLRGFAKSSLLYPSLMNILLGLFHYTTRKD